MKTRINLSGHDFQLLQSLQLMIVVTARIGRPAEDLNIPSKLVELETENDLYEEAKAQKADIIIQRMDRSQVYRENISASV